MNKLTTREKTALELLANGRSQKEIADKMHVTARTVDTYIKRLKEKLGIYKNTELTAFWFSTGHRPKRRLVRMFKNAFPLLIAIVVWVFALLTKTPEQGNAATHLNEPGAGGFEGLALLVIVIAVCIYIFSDEKNGETNSTN